MPERTDSTFSPKINVIDKLADRFLLYIGPVNSVAIHRNSPEGARKAFDQHAVVYHRPDKPDIDSWEDGTLKVYCPSILPAFPAGPQLRKLNNLLFTAEPYLYQDVNLLEAIRLSAEPFDYHYFVGRLDSHLKRNIGTPDLARRALDDNFLAFDRSIKLQNMFIFEDSENRNHTFVEEAIIALARQKAVFIAMAPHYAVEAIFDDQFADFPYHLPDHIHETILENTPQIYPPEFDLPAYERGLHHSLFGAPSPDLFRFAPILASLVAPVVMKDDNSFYHYDTWEEFHTSVIASLNGDPVVSQAMEMFARGMQIPVEFAYFAAFKMCQKEVRKRGSGHLFTPEEAKEQAQKIVQGFNIDLEYFSAKDPYLRLNYYEEGGDRFRGGRGEKLSRTRFMLYRQALIDRAAVEHINSVIGTYKFIPWVKADDNFSGTYLPYALMKSGKARIVDILCSSEFLSYWKEKGYWFRDVLPELMKSHPSMYSKWFIPLLERGMIDDGIINAATEKAYRYLIRLIELE